MTQDMVWYGFRKIPQQRIGVVQHPHLANTFQPIIRDNTHEGQIAPSSSHNNAFDINNFHTSPALLVDSQTTLDYLDENQPAQAQEWPVRERRAAIARRLDSNAQAGPSRSLHASLAHGSAQATDFRDLSDFTQFQLVGPWLTTYDKRIKTIHNDSFRYGPASE